MKFAMCNELLAAEGMSFDEQCRLCASLGYDGIEIAPGSFAREPHRLSNSDAERWRDIAGQHGLEVVGFHWLLAPYPALSITSDDPTITKKTQAVLLRLCELCAAAGGTVLVHGSPAQRSANGLPLAQSLLKAAAFFSPIADRCHQLGITYCFEPLSRHETDFINNIAEARLLVDQIASPSFRTMIDTSAAGLSETQPVAALIRTWIPQGYISHIQFNDTNRGIPGTGQDKFGGILQALNDVKWTGFVSMEPFTVTENAAVTAAIGLATVNAHKEWLS